jgi:chromosome partitioning protein
MIIVIAHNKGGVGKTTTALNLADSLAPAIVIDQDTHGMISILNNLRRDKTQLNIVKPASEQQLFDALSVNGLVLVDCGGFDSDLNRMTIAAADLVIVPANDDIQELIGLQSFSETLTQISQATGKHISAKVLFTRTNPRRKNFADVENFINQTDNLSRLTARLSARNQFKQAAAMGYGVLGHHTTKHSAAAQEVAALTHEIKDLING